MVQQQREVSQFHTEDHVSPIDQILDATCRIVARYGFHGATVERVAIQAQLPTTAITRYFPTRAALFNAAAEHNTARFTDQIRAKIAGERSPLDKLRCLVQQCLTLSATHGGFCESLLLDGNSWQESALPLEVTSLSQRHLVHPHFIEAIIREGVRVGLLRPHHTEASAFFLHEAMWSCLLRHVLALEPYTPSIAAIDAELLLDLFFQGLVNTESKAPPRKDKRQ